MHNELWKTFTRYTFLRQINDSNPFGQGRVCLGRPRRVCVHGTLGQVPLSAYLDVANCEDHHCIGHSCNGNHGPFTITISGHETCKHHFRFRVLWTLSCNLGMGRVICIHKRCVLAAILVVVFPQDHCNFLSTGPCTRVSFCRGLTQHACPEHRHIVCLGSVIEESVSILIQCPWLSLNHIDLIICLESIQLYNLNFITCKTFTLLLSYRNFFENASEEEDLRR